MLKKNIASSFIPLYYNHVDRCSSQIQYNEMCVCKCKCVNSSLLSCLPPCLLFSGVQCRSLLHSPNVSQVSLCSLILVNLSDITFRAVTSTLFPVLPVISIVPAIFTCSIKHIHIAPSHFIPCSLEPQPGTISKDALPHS